MKVGDYVRNKYGIAKIIDIENNNGIDILEFNKDICFLVNKETGEIKDDKLFNKLAIIDGIDLSKIKSSPNIIDLIEVGDFVNGHRVDFTNINNKLSYEDKCIGFYDGDGDIILFENDIKSILTKEQFEAMEYKVEER